VHRHIWHNSNFLKAGVYFILLAHFNLNAKFSSEIFDVDFDSITFTVGKIELHKSVLNVLKCFPITELNLS
jgi:hypothetical protein